MNMSLKNVLSVLAIAAIASTSFAAEETKSLLPAFGPEGTEVSAAAQGGNKITGWLPKDWVDNSEWASVSVTYSKLSDPPKDGVTAIRANVTKVDEGQMQFTTWTKPSFKKDMKYVVEGSIRSKDSAGIKVGIRQPGEPYEFFAEQELTTTADWKPFKFEFTLSADQEAFVMFVKTDAGAVDLAGISVHEAK